MSDQKQHFPPIITVLIAALVNAFSLIGINVCGEDFEINQNNFGLVIRLKWTYHTESNSSTSVPSIPPEKETSQSIPKKRKYGPSRIRKRMARLAAYFVKKASKYSRESKPVDECNYNEFAVSKSDSGTQTVTPHEHNSKRPWNNLCRQLKFLYEKVDSCCPGQQKFLSPRLFKIYNQIMDLGKLFCSNLFEIHCVDENCKAADNRTSPRHKDIHKRRLISAFNHLKNGSWEEKDYHAWELPWDINKIEFHIPGICSNKAPDDLDQLLFRKRSGSSAFGLRVAGPGIAGEHNAADVDSIECIQLNDMFQVHDYYEHKVNKKIVKLSYYSSVERRKYYLDKYSDQEYYSCSDAD